MAERTLSPPPGGVPPGDRPMKGEGRVRLVRVRLPDGVWRIQHMGITEVLP